MLNLEETEKVAIACIATGARPAPQFKWYIGDQLYNQNINTSIENLQDDRATYTSTFNYIGNPKDIAHMLKCEVIHKGYTNQQLSDEDNLEEAQLNLSFKPDPDAKITCYQMEGNVDYKEISCYKMKNGKSSMAKIMFLANPKPTEGEWHVIGKTPIPTNSSIDDFSSSPISDGDLEGEYQVTLDFNMTSEIAAGNNFFKVTNNLGTTEIKFDFEITTSSTESPAGPSTVPPTLQPTLPPTELPTEPHTEPSTDQNPGYKPDIVSVTYHGFQNKENSVIEIIFRASPMPDGGHWYIGNTQISFGTTEGQYLGESNVDEKFISSQIKNTEENLSDSYLVQLNFTTVPELEEKQCSFVVENSFGATNKTFQMPKIKLEPTPEPPIEPPTEPPNGPISRPVTKPVTGPVTGPPVGPPTEPKFKFKPEIVNVNYTRQV